MPLVSICIPAYSNPESLKRLLDSVFDQTFVDYEVVITDDSPDETVKIVVDSYSDDRIRYYKNKKQLGTPENWNEAIRKAKGDFIKIMHHDDWFSSQESLMVFVNYMLENDCILIFSQSDNVKNNQIISQNRPDKRICNFIKEYPFELFFSNYIGAPSTVLFKKNKVLFDNNLKWFVDVEFYFKTIFDNNHECIFCIEDSLINIGNDENRVTDFCLKNQNLVHMEFLYSLFSMYNKNRLSFYSINRCFYRFLNIYSIKKYSKISKYVELKFQLPFYILYCIYIIKHCK